MVLPLIGVLSSFAPIIPAVIKLFGNEKDSEKAQEFVDIIGKNKFFEELIEATIKNLKESGHNEVAEAVKKSGNSNTDGSSEAERVKKTIEGDAALQAKLVADIASLSERKIEEIKEENRSREEQQRIAIERLRSEAEVAQQAREDDRAEFRMYMDSLNEARIANSRAVETGAIPNWFNPVLSLIVICFMCYVVYHLMSPNAIIHEKNRDVLNIVLGAIGTAFATIIGYHFGSSSGSKSKDETFRLALERGTIVGPPRDGAHIGDEYQASQRPGSKAEPTLSSRNTAQSDIELANQALKSADPFPVIAPIMMRGLINELTLTRDQAAGVIGNIAHECGNFRQMQEIKPLSGLGGLGFCQWTGPRRRSFEAFAKSINASVGSYEANWGFLMHELRGSEKMALLALRAATSLEDATEIFMKKFERPGIPHLKSRLAYASRALRVSDAV